MSCWTAARSVAQFLQSNQQEEIIDILEPYSLEQRRFIISIKYAFSSLLFIAVEKQSVFLVNYFLESCGADPNSVGWMHGEELTSLCVAVRLNSEILVNILLTHGANTEILYSSERRTALHFACRNGRLQIAKLLIKHGANVNSRDYIGRTCLMESINNLILCKYLIFVGANVNLVNDCGDTALALAYKTGRNRIISFLLSSENTDVRIKTDFEEDVLHLAVQFSSENVINKIKRKGSYSNDEVIQVYELQSCLFYVNNFKQKSNELWEKALQLRFEPSDTPLFRTPHPAGKLQEVVDVFNADDIPALLYLESVYGLSNMFTLQAFVSAVYKVSDIDEYIILCNFFFNTIYSLDDHFFFLASNQAEQLMWFSFTLNIVFDKLNALNAFEMIVKYILEIRARLERMTPRERIPHAYRVELMLYFVIDMIHEFEWFCENIYSFHKGIVRILTADLRGLNQESLLQLCAALSKPFRMLRLLLECRADVNSTDNEGKTVLHALVELKNASSDFKTIIDNGFDFHLVKCDEYCLPCRMEREGILPNPVKHISLQCLAAKAFCEKTMNCFSDVPHHLMAFVISHLHL